MNLEFLLIYLLFTFCPTFFLGTKESIGVSYSYLVWLEILLDLAKVQSSE